jgi:hypothetical protein
VDLLVGKLNFGACAALDDNGSSNNSTNKKRLACLVSMAASTLRYYYQYGMRFLPPVASLFKSFSFFMTSCDLARDGTIPYSTKSILDIVHKTMPCQQLPGTVEFRNDQLGVFF